MIVGVMVMIVTICVVVGFKRTITEKVAGFGAHIQLVSFDNNNTYDLQPIEVSDSLMERLGRYTHVVKAAPFITKPGMLKTDSAHGVEGHGLLGFLCEQCAGRGSSEFSARGVAVRAHGI